MLVMVSSSSLWETGLAWRESNIAYPVPGATTRTTTYDDHERPSEVTFHDANNALVSRVVFSRSDEGRALSERMEFAGPRGLVVRKNNW